MVLTASGLNPLAQVNNCNIVSKKETDALDVIVKSKWWVTVLSHSKVLAPCLATRRQTSTEIEFSNGFMIRAETQNENALRSKSGHAYLDEFGFYVYQEPIWSGGVPSTLSRPDLRVTITSTPNGTNDIYHEIYTDDNMHSEWSRHKTDIHEAIAQGANPRAARDAKMMLSPLKYQQEMECVFLGGDGDVFGAVFIQSCYDNYIPSDHRVLWLGVDVASVVDTTVIQCLWVQGKTVWIGDTYQIASGVPYESDITRRICGQQMIVDALIRTLNPIGVVMDVTGDAGRHKITNMTPLYSLLTRTEDGGSGNPHTRILPQSINNQWKSKEVRALKDSMDGGRTKFVIGRQDYIWSPVHSPDYLVAPVIPIGHPTLSPVSFIATTFEQSGFKLLEADMKKVRAKYDGTKLTYDTDRKGGTGHGDAVWALVLGHSVARIPKANKWGTLEAQGEKKEVVSEIIVPDYLNQGW